MRGALRALAVGIAIVATIALLPANQPSGNNASPLPYPYPTQFQVFLPFISQLFEPGPSPTAIPPTPTPTQTSAPTATATSIALPTATNTPSPTATNTPLPGPPTATPPADGWLGEYFSSTIPTGSPVLTRYSAEVNFDWGTGSPDPSINADFFSVRWTRTLNFAGGYWRFHTLTDDGVRLWVDGTLLIDQWKKMPATEFTADLYLSAGTHAVKMEYYEDNEEAAAKLWWEPFPAPCPTGQFRAEYFANVALSGNPAFSQCEPAVDHDWGLGSPASGIGADFFAVRWTGTLNLPAGNYRFHTGTDDGVRLWIDNSLVIDEWRKMEATEFTADVALSAGNHVVRVEYYEDNEEAVARLWWEEQ